MSPQKMRYVTRHFYDLQGLRLVPFGAFVLLTSAQPIYDFLPEAFQIGFLLAALVLTFGLMYMVGQFYKQQYGHVEADQQWYWQTIGLAVVFIGSLWMDAYLDLPFSAAGLGMGVYLIALWRPRLGIRRHYAVAGLLVVASTIAVPLLSDAVQHLDYGHFSELLTVLAGFGLVVCGLLDHLTLVRTLDTARPAEAVHE